MLRADDRTDELLAPLWALLDQPDFRAAIEALGGYSCAETGRLIRPGAGADHLRGGGRGAAPAGDGGGQGGGCRHTGDRIAREAAE